MELSESRGAFGESRSALGKQRRYVRAGVLPDLVYKAEPPESQDIHL